MAGSVEDQSNKGVSALAGKYLTLIVGNEVYGISILKVKEIIGVGNMEIIAVPNMPEYAKGVINLRDKVIPVLALRLRFNMEEIEYTDRTCIVVVEVQADNDKELLMGLIVDSVSEVLAVTAKEIEPPPSFGSTLKTEYILGMAKVKGDVNILLDIDKVLSAEEIDVMAEAV